MDKLNFINEYTTHHVITSLYEVNQFLKFFSKPDTILLKKISHEFWQSDKAFDHFFIDKKNDLVHVYTVKKDHLKFIHLKRDLKELTCLSELEKNYQALLCKKSTLEQVIKNFPIPICELSKQHTIINQNDAFRTKIGNDVSLEEDTIFPLDIKISINDQRNHWQFEKLSLNEHDFIIATDISLKDDLQKKLDTLENTYANLLDKLNISIGIFKHDTRLSIYNQTYLKTWGVTEKFIKTKPTLGEMIDHLRDIKILPELHNYEYFKQDRLELFKNLLTEKEEILYLPNEKIHRTIISPYPDGALMFIHEDISETYQMKSNLQSLENLANTVINDMDDLILIFSDNGRLRYFNTLKEEFKLFESIKFEKNFDRALLFSFILFILQNSL